ncbi:MAG: DUF3500 domain-containing protein [Planctomycetaceae bacterium]
MTNELTPNVNRRTFLSAVGTAAVAGSVVGLPENAFAATRSSSAEEVVKELHASLSDSQKKILCLPVTHKSRSRINPNWHITKPILGQDFYSKSQRELALRVVKSLCSEDGYERFQKQMDDDSGGIDDYSMAFFGEPDSGDFQWELTGRHLTLRADGDRNDRMAFGGPLVYGHGEEDKPEDNLFFYQTQQVNKVFAALDSKQRDKAMIAKSPKETQVKLQGSGGRFGGISGADLSRDQKELLADSLKVLLKPFRAEDVQEVMWILLENGGIDSLNMAFSKQGDLNSDGIWDVWRLEGPAFVWHFRGAPHVHAYINIAGRTQVG